jgi:hypothetical protein
MVAEMLHPERFSGLMPAGDALWLYVEQLKAPGLA